ncbi:hypothetical protein LEN26_020779 [Aphanomyces euteiches]|nr:hypothetical protein LEN26_020779 [Aphanomyces euteiches]KAH9164880.1 hypothetical protein AeNC1_018615 [Aphanomyces euteiches]
MEVRRTSTDKVKCLAELAASTMNQHAIQAFESGGGVATLRMWLERSIVSQNNVLVLSILHCLRVMPLSLSTILDSSINQPILKLRRESSRQVQEAAQDLLRHWRRTFKEAKHKVEPVLPAVLPFNRSTKPPSSKRIAWADVMGFHLCHIRLIETKAEMKGHYHAASRDRARKRRSVAILNEIIPKRTEHATEAHSSLPSLLAPSPRSNDASSGQSQTILQPTRLHHDHISNSIIV